SLLLMNNKQLNANRRNAKKSTGPKTPAGKALVALNSVAHGGYCILPVIEGLESKRGWTAYRFAMLENMAPIGMLEMILAERVILTAWRLRRVARFEAEQIRLSQENALEAVGRRLKYDLEYDSDLEEDETPEPLGVQGILDEAAWHERSWQRMS